MLLIRVFSGLDEILTFTDDISERLHDPEHPAAE